MVRTAMVHVSKQYGAEKGGEKEDECQTSDLQ